MGQIKAVIYDCDGVIVNSNNAIISYYSWLAEKSDVEIPDWSDEKFKRIVLSYTEDDIVDVISKGNQEIKERIYNIPILSPDTILKINYDFKNKK